MCCRNACYRYFPSFQSCGHRRSPSDYVLLTACVRALIQVPSLYVFCLCVCMCAIMYMHDDVQHGTHSAWGAGVVLEPWSPEGSVVMKPGLTFNEMNQLHGQLQQTRWASRFGSDVPKQVSFSRFHPLASKHKCTSTQTGAQTHAERQCHTILHVRVATNVITVHTSRFGVGCCPGRDSF